MPRINNVVTEMFHARSRKISNSVLILFIIVWWDNIVIGQKTGGICRLKNGQMGICKPISQCMVAFDSAFQGEDLQLCNFETNMVNVCCGDNIHIQYQSIHNDHPYNIISRQKPIQTSSGNVNQYYIVDPADISVIPRDYQYRYARDKQWWVFEKPFTVSTTKTSTTTTTTTQANYFPERPNFGSLNKPWWIIAERPFGSSHHSPSLPSVTQSPPQTNPPMNEAQQSSKQTQSTPRRQTPSSILTNPPPPRQTPPPVTNPPETPIRKPPTSGERISERKCADYSRLVTTPIIALPLVPSPEPVRIDIPKCDFTSLELIVGGEETKPKEFPHMAALGYKNGGRIDWKCGGSLISELYVLTAAHCTPRNNLPIIARLGELNLKRYDDGAKPENYGVVDWIRHPDFKPPAKYNDIALLKLDRPVTFNEFIRPACLYMKETFDVNKTVATGWGKIDFAEKPSDILLKVAVTIIDNKLCNELYELDGETKELTNGIAPTMMCAGELEGGKDTCQGDSGGPIQITKSDNQCVYNIIGVTSFGKFCAAKNAPGVYTRVSSYVSWIENIVWPNS